MLVYGHRTVRLSTGEAIADFMKRLECFPTIPEHDASAPRCVLFKDATRLVARLKVLEALKVLKVLEVRFS